MSPARRTRLVRGCVAALGCSALAGCGAGGGTSTSPAAGRGLGPKGHAVTGSIPAEIDSKPQGFFSTALVRPLVNAWRTADRTRFTEVDAGALASDHSVGVLAIFRHRLTGARQRASLVKVVGSGPLRITGAPTGAGVEARAQRSGELRFVGARGVRGTLHLSDDSVALRPPRSTKQS